MVNEQSVLQDAISTLSDAFSSDGILVMPRDQSRPNRIPCIVLSVSSQPAVNGLGGEYLANVRIRATVYARNIYAPENSEDGVQNIFDRMNVVMNARYYTRSNQTDPYYNAAMDVWNKDGFFTKRANKF